MVLIHSELIPIIVVGLVIAMAVQARNTYLSRLPNWREDCNECAAHKRKFQEAKWLEEHKEWHRRWGNCETESCEHNRRFPR